MMKNNNNNKEKTCFTNSESESESESESGSEQKQKQKIRPNYRKYLIMSPTTGYKFIHRNDSEAVAQIENKSKSYLRLQLNPLLEFKYALYYIHEPFGQRKHRNHYVEWFLEDRSVLYKNDLIYDTFILYCSQEADPSILLKIVEEAATYYPKCPWVENPLFYVGHLLDTFMLFDHPGYTPMLNVADAPK